MASLNIYTFIFRPQVIFYLSTIDKNEIIDQVTFAIIITYSFSVFRNFTKIFKILISSYLTRLFELYFIIHEFWYLLIIFINSGSMTLVA